jgi:hypothetical protein
MHGLLADWLHLSLPHFRVKVSRIGDLYNGRSNVAAEGVAPFILG